ncbi:hypothetical protein ACXR0O_24425 [Verrucomicrobiota bacterium sgz303538]
MRIDTADTLARTNRTRSTGDFAGATISPVVLIKAVHDKQLSYRLTVGNAAPRNDVGVDELLAFG